MSAASASLGLATFAAVAVALTASPATAQTCVTPPSNLVSWWPMDDETADVIDSNQPSNANAVTFVTGSVAMGASLGAGGFIDIAHSANLANQRFTLEALVRPDGPGPNNDSIGSVIILKNFSGSITTAGLSWRAIDNRFLFTFGDSATERILSTNTFLPGQFHHVVASYDGVTFRLYVNGAAQGQLALVKTIAYSAGVPWCIGSSTPAFRSLGFPRTWNGVLDEVAVYSRALTPAEIANQHAAGIAGKCKPAPPGFCLPAPTGLVSWWPLDSSTVDIQDGNSASGSSGASFVAGKVDGGLRLASSGYVDIAHSASLANQRFTIAAWVRADGAGPNNDAFGSVIVAKQKSMPAGNTDVPIWLTWSAATNQFGFGFGNVFTQRIVSAQTFPPGQYHHVAGTYDGAVFQLYVDGALQGQFNLVKTIEFDAAIPWTIGSNAPPFRAGSFPRTWNGIIDEVEIYNQALSADEIQDAFAARSRGHCKVFDIVAPVVTITSPANLAVVNGTSVTLTATVVDDTATNVVSTPAGIDTTLPDGGGTVSGTIPLLEGINTISVTAEDEGHNIGGTSIIVNRDTVAPAMLVLSPLEGSIVGDTPAPITALVVDDSFQVILTIGPFPFVLTFPPRGATRTALVDLNEGPNTVLIIATDQGNNQTVIPLHLTLDSNSPLVSISSPADGARFGAGQSPIAVTVTVDDVTSTTVSSSPVGVSGSLPAGGGVLIGTLALAEGTNSIQVTALDEVGLTGTGSVTVILDTTAPSVSIDSPVQDAPVRGVVDFHVDAEDVTPGSQIARVEMFVDGVLFATVLDEPYERTLDTAPFADGVHELRARAVDGVGNFSVVSIQVRVDNTAPSVSIGDLVAGQFVSGAAAFSVDVSDAGSGLASVEILAGGSPPSDDPSGVYSPPAIVTTDTRFGEHDTSRGLDGPLTFVARVTDRAGNEATTEVTVTVDNTAPQKTLVSPTDGSTVSGIIQIVAEFDDPNLDVIEIRVNGQLVATSSTSPISVSFDTRTRLDGTLSVTATARDFARNISQCTAVVTVNNVTFRLDPQTLNLKSKGGANSVTAYLEGTSLALLLPTEANSIALLVPGGNPVPATAGFSGDDFTSDSDNDGIPELVIKFDRQKLIQSIQAGIAAGAIQANSTVTLTLVASGGSVLGTDSTRINH
jgi:hypothetical protein